MSKLHPFLLLLTLGLSACGSSGGSAPDPAQTALFNARPDTPVRQDKAGQS